MSTLPQSLFNEINCACAKIDAKPVSDDAKAKLQVEALTKIFAKYDITQEALDRALAERRADPVHKLIDKAFQELVFGPFLLMSVPQNVIDEAKENQERCHKQMTLALGDPAAVDDMLEEMFDYIDKIAVARFNKKAR